MILFCHKGHIIIMKVKGIVSKRLKDVMAAYPSNINTLKPSNIFSFANLICQNGIKRVTTFLMIIYDKIRFNV